MGAAEPGRERLLRWIRLKPYTFGVSVAALLAPLLFLIINPPVGLMILVIVGFLLAVWGLIHVVIHVIDEAFD